MDIRWGLAVAAVPVCALAFPLSAGLAGAACGDDHVDGDEQCDGTDLGGVTCTDLTGGFVPPGQGTLTCKGDCTFDARDCLRLFEVTDDDPCSG